MWWHIFQNIQINSRAHPASYSMGTGVLSCGVKSGRDVTLTPHPLLVPWSWKSRAIPLLPLWAVRLVQSLSACTRVHFTFFLTVRMCLVLEVWCNLFFNLGTRSRWVLGFTTRQLYPRIPAPGIHWIVVSADPRAAVTFWRRKSLSLFEPETKPRFVGGPTHSIKVKVKQSH